MNCWSIAEHAGEADPQEMQRLPSAAVTFDTLHTVGANLDWLTRNKEATTSPS
jgi:hypothetical protein